MFGRRKTSIVGGLVCVLGTFFGLFCQSYEFMVVIRLMQGFGNFISYAGTYIWILEFVSENMRIYYNFWSMMLWALGKGPVQSMPEHLLIISIYSLSQCVDCSYCCRLPGPGLYLLLHPQLALHPCGCSSHLPSLLHPYILPSRLSQVTPQSNSLMWCQPLEYSQRPYHTPYCYLYPTGIYCLSANLKRPSWCWSPMQV